ncbi:hypothetical protein OSB04_028077 [Centaurea solstitialis]|uniref:DUF8040 domain-containing protein n=1 Tax=Centaurea solstitialis TaxID=347529 RepID=A0AA38SRZ2_9ASTR|nr:hypothetical protein OSB04_028077 [Centaurea solstitialis]
MVAVVGLLAGLRETPVGDATLGVLVTSLRIVRGGAETASLRLNVGMSKHEEKKRKELISLDIMLIDVKRKMSQLLQRRGKMKITFQSPFSIPTLVSAFGGSVNNIDNKIQLREKLTKCVQLLDRQPLMPIPTDEQDNEHNMRRYPILHRCIYESNTMSISQIRMSRRCFTKLRHMLEIFENLNPSRNMNIDEQVVIFLHIFAHNAKNCVIICRFFRSEETVSRHFARVCNATIRLHTCLLKKLELVPNNSSD